jgi:hypothetical protein
MIDPSRLLADLTALTKVLETDLRQRCDASPAVDVPLRAEYDAARAAGRTADTYTEWREDRITQSAVHWILACVFVRFLEDNYFVAHPRDEGPFLSGPGERLHLARDRRTVYFQHHPSETDREYLLDVFRQLAALPSAGPLFDPKTNPLFTLPLSGDGAGTLLAFWQKVDPQTGALIHDFASPDRNTRFLGDLYQDLSEAARSHYALLQTPEFVEEFILDRTLTPAIETFGWREVRLLDPTCGSGHFLLGAFYRLLALWNRHEPGTNERTRVQLALDAVAGVDLNPFAIAIARFRLLIAALTASHVERLKDAPKFEIHLATGDSLLHGKRFLIRTREAARMGGEQMDLTPAAQPLRHVYDTEDREALQKLLGRQYHAVVGNPPYIVVRDAALNQAYRNEYGSCSGKYSLGVPFTERFFELALGAGPDDRAGYIGMITTNSFMKREFGKKLIEKFVPSWDLTHVLDMSGAYIPGHGTPTVILFGRNRLPEQKTVRAVMGIRGEPSTPVDPAKGLVWSAVVEQVDRPGSQSAFVSVADVERARFHSHPWSLGGGGAAELKELIEERAAKRLGDEADSIGFASFTGVDEVFLGDAGQWRRLRIPLSLVRTSVDGESVRDWTTSALGHALVPYDSDHRAVEFVATSAWGRYLWPFRSTIEGVVSFGGRTRKQNGDAWWTWYRWIAAKYAVPLSLGYAEVATHNHFVLDRGGKVFKQTAPVIKLPADATEDDHLTLLGLLNSSTACFWMKQVAHQKQMTGGDGVRIESRSKVPYQFSGTQLGQLPLPASGPLSDRVLHLAKEIDRASVRSSELTAAAVLASPGLTAAMGLSKWREFSAERQALRGQMIRLQEELDFTIYEMCGLSASGLLDTEALERNLPMEPGARVFCLLSGKNEDSFPVPQSIPSEWPADVRDLWRRRMDAVRRSPELSIIEDPHYKRRWIGRQGLFNKDRGRDELIDACEQWLLDRLESPAYWPVTELQTVARLADRAREDAELHAVAEIYRGRADFDVTALVHELCTGEAVPFLPVLRYSEAGLRKRAEWERTWDLQRAEDAIDARATLPESDPKSLTEAEAKVKKSAEVGDIPVPPKYAQTDFRRGEYWRLRGKLDVPKERFISYPGGERAGDPTPLLGWAGWDHLQQAQALAAFYVRMRDEEGWPDERLAPLLAGLQDLLPWLHQWHAAFDPTWQTSLATYFQNFVDEETRARGLTPDSLKAWQPPAGTGPKRGRKKKPANTDGP